MKVNVNMDDLSDEIRDYLNQYKYQLTTEIEGALEETAKWGVDALKEGGPYKEQTGEYTKDWDYKENKKFSRLNNLPEFTIYNKKHYRLTHLLENGHATRKGGRTSKENKKNRVEAYPHIGRVSDMIPDIVVGLINKAVVKANGEI